VKGANPMIETGPIPTVDEPTLIKGKIEQATQIMNELDLDLWLTFTSEIGDGGADPVYPMIFGERDVPGGVLVMSRAGDRVSIVGGLDVAVPPATGIWTDVINSAGDPAGCLATLVRRFDPGRIAINYSLTDRKADGLSHGQFLWLQSALAGTRYAAALVSAEELIRRLRGRKSPEEVGRIREAVRQTESIFAELGRFIRAGRTGREMYDFTLREVRRRGLETAWSVDHCPIVTVGPVAPIGHTPPGTTVLQPGWTLQVDFGVKVNGFCADMQRMWYCRAPGETGVPAEVERLFRTVRRGVDVVIENIRPGVPTWHPAEAVRGLLPEAGYPEFTYGVGHSLGRATHDGAPNLGTKDDGRPSGTIEPGNVLTAEGLETLLEGRGWISLEDDVLVTATGNEVLSTQQREMMVV
jgi:Xaa-Pro aminopeptidase